MSLQWVGQPECIIQPTFVASTVFFFFSSVGYGRQLFPFKSYISKKKKCSGRSARRSFITFAEQLLLHVSSQNLFPLCDCTPRCDKLSLSVAPVIPGVTFCLWRQVCHFWSMRFWDIYIISVIFFCFLKNLMYSDIHSATVSNELHRCSKNYAN